MLLLLPIPLPLRLLLPLLLGCNQSCVVVEELHEFAFKEGPGEDREGAHGYEEEEGGLGVFAEKHGNEGLHDAVEVPCEGEVEVGQGYAVAWLLWRGVLIVGDGVVDVKLKAERDEDAWDDEITEADHATTFRPSIGLKTTSRITDPNNNGPISRYVKTVGDKSSAGQVT